MNSYMPRNLITKKKRTKFLDTAHQNRIKKETDNLNRLITRSERVSWDGNIHAHTLYKEKFKTKWLHRQILPYTNKNLSNPFSSFSKRSERKEILPQMSYEATMTLILKLTKHHQKIKLESNIFDEYRCKIPQENTNKLNLSAHKTDYTTYSPGIHPKFTRIEPHTQTNQYDMSCVEKTHYHLNRYLKNISNKNSYIHSYTKTSSKEGIKGTYFKNN